MKELEITLENGSIAFVNEIRPGKDGLKRFLVESEDGSFDSFTYTPNGKTQDGDGITPSQRSVLIQITPQLSK